MPFKYDISAPGFPVMHEFFQVYGVSSAPIATWEPQWGIQAGSKAPVVRVIDNVAKADRLIWGTPKPGSDNERATTTDRISGHRCLIPVSSAYEWAPESRRAWEREEYRFTAIARKWFMAGGIWQRDANTGEDSFMMITTAAGPDVKDAFSRQVLVIPPAQWRAWLDQFADINQFSAHARAGTFSFAPAR